MVGVSPPTIAKWASWGMPGERGKYCVPDVIAWARSEGPWKEKPTRQPTDDDALLYADADSPNLERLRAAKADIEEIKLEQIRGSVIPVDAIRSKLGRLAAMLRRFGELVSKSCPALASQFNDVLGEFQSTLDEEFGE